MNALDRIIESFPNRLAQEDIDLRAYMEESYQPRVKSATAYRDDLKKRIRSKGVWGAKSGFMALEDNFRFRPREVTVWVGYKGHGKSAVLSQVLLSLMQKERQKCFIISPEFHPVELLYRFLVQCLGDEEVSDDEADCLIDFLAEFCWLYDVQASLKPQEVPALCRWVMDHIKPDHIVIDSLMKCGIAPDDYAKQKQLVDQIQNVAHTNDVHIHLVAHARKGQSDEHPPKLHDIKGASEIGDLVENVISVWRNKPKEKAATGYGTGKDLIEEPDCILTIEAQRNCGGWLGQVPLSYQRSAMVYYEQYRDWRSYVSILGGVPL